MTVDVWMQHPTLRFLRHEMFEPLWRWTGQEVPDEELSIEATVVAMDAGGVELGLLSAWHSPREGALFPLRLQGGRETGTIGFGANSQEFPKSGNR